MKTKQKEDRKAILLKIEKEYENSEKPVIYEYKHPASTVQQRKFGLLITYIKDMLENGMKPEYLKEDEDSIEYWNELARQFKGTYEMDFVSEELYGKNKQKLKEYIAVLLHTRNLFTTIQEIQDKMQYLYAEPKNFKDELDAIRFLKEGEFCITCEMVKQFNTYAEERLEKEEMDRIQKEKQKLEQQKKLREKYEYQERLKRQEEARQRALEQSRRLEQQRLEKARREKQEQKKNKRTVEESWMPENIKLELTRPSVAKPTPYSNGDYAETANHGHMKNSQRLFQANFKEMQSQYTFAQRPVESTDKAACFQCKKPLSVGLYIIGHNINYCYYTGQWYCNDCISTERVPILWKAMESFDLRGYNVCKKAFIEIKSLYQRPIIQINSEANIVKNNAKLFNFLILKRELHLMYDSICNTEFIERLLGSRINYCLKQNIFSLKNLYDIYNSQEEVYLSKIVESLSAHFYQCKECQKKGYKCKICNNAARIFPFELRTTKGCTTCKKLYHRECFQVKGCMCSHS